MLARRRLVAKERRAANRRTQAEEEVGEAEEAGEAADAQQPQVQQEAAEAAASSASPSRRIWALSVGHGRLSPVFHGVCSWGVTFRLCLTARVCTDVYILHI